MKYYFLIFITISLNCFSQNLQKLDENNGFRDIKLGSEINKYQDEIEATVSNHLVYVNNNPYSISYGYDYAIKRPNNKYEKIGEAKILGIFLSVYKSKIREIKVVTEFRLETYELMKLAYGNSLLGESSITANWFTKKIFCSLNATSPKPDITIITYTDRYIDDQFDLENRIKEKEELKLKQSKAISEF